MNDRTTADTLADLLELLWHTNAVIRLHNCATGDAFPLMPPMLICALAAVPAEDFPRLAERTRATLTEALHLAECPHPYTRTAAYEHAR
mgnify:FL=1